MTPTTTTTTKNTILRLRLLAVKKSAIYTSLFIVSHFWSVSVKKSATFTFLRGCGSTGTTVALAFGQDAIIKRG